VDKVITEQRGHVLVVTINRPEARNAVDRDVCVGIGDAVEQAEADPNIRALILTAPVIRRSAPARTSGHGPR